MAIHSSIPVWRIPGTEELGRLKSMGSKESDTTEQLHFCSQESLVRSKSVRNLVSSPLALLQRQLETGVS